MFVCVERLCFSSMVEWFENSSFEFFEIMLALQWIFIGSLLPDIPNRRTRVTHLGQSSANFFENSVCKSCQTRVESFLKNYSMDNFFYLIDWKSMCYILWNMFVIDVKKWFDFLLAKSWFGWIEFLMIWFSQIQSHLVKYL